MDVKSGIKLAVIIVYFVLSIIFWRIDTYELDCKEDYETICVSFCSEDENSLPDSLIRASFHLNDTILDFLNDYKIIRGKPMCLLTNIYDPHEDTSEEYDYHDFSYDSKLQFLYFTPHQYCKNMIMENGEIKWETIVCNSSQTFRFLFHGFVISLSVLVLTVTLSVYLSFKQLRDFHGICILNFLVPLLLIMLFQPTLHYDEYISFRMYNYFTMTLEVLYTFASLWISVTCFDIFWTFLKLYKNLGDIPNRLQVYTIFTLSATIFTATVYIVETHSDTIFDDFISFTNILKFISKFLIFVNVTFFVLAIWFKYQCMKNYDADYYAEYEMENRWFWLRFQIIVTLLVTYVIEVNSFRSDNVFEVFLIADFLKLFCSIVIFAIVILDRDEVVVLLIEKYNMFKSRGGGTHFVNILA